MKDYCERNNIKVGSDEFNQLITYKDPSFLHPWYGPCDGFGSGGSCAECEELIGYLEDIRSKRIRGINN